jgi:hypothetical protein
MYFPYLRGRQFELIALREFAIQSEGDQKVIPIIEPVRKTFNSLKIALTKFEVSDFAFALILNPQVGEIESINEIFDALSDELKAVSWIPSFIVQNNIKEIEEYIEQNNFSDVMLICSNNTDTSSSEFLDFALGEDVKYIVFEENKSLRRRLKGTDKNVILLSDCFKPKKRNSDYLDAPPEKFTEENIFFEEENYFGFSDYTTVTSEFNEGGTTPYAVSIHLTYKKNNEEIWIRHFTSISNDDKANIQGKFAEAAQKTVNFMDKKDIKTIASNELRDYYRLPKYPGLGMVKKISIKHHLELINGIF